MLSHRLRWNIEEYLPRSRPVTEPLVSCRCTHQLGHGDPILKQNPKSPTAHPLHSIPPFISNPPVIPSAPPPIFILNLIASHHLRHLDPNPSDPHIPPRSQQQAPALLTLPTHQPSPCTGHLGVFPKYKSDVTPKRELSRGFQMRSNSTLNHNLYDLATDQPSASPSSLPLWTSRHTHTGHLPSPATC